jgi:hypothetical protein
MVCVTHDDELGLLCSCSTPCRADYFCALLLHVLHSPSCPVLLQLWRISDLLYLPEDQVVAELEAHR